VHRVKGYYDYGFLETLVVRGRSIRKITRAIKLRNKNLKTLWIHFGQHKTGSTAIQHALKLSCEHNSSYTHLCSPRGNGSSSKLIINAFIGDNDSAREVARRRLERLFFEIETDIAIISAESICRLKGPEIRDFLDFCSWYCEDIRFIGYVRSPVEYARSAFQQVLKRSRRELLIDRRNPVFRFLKQLCNHVDPESIYIDSYEECLSKHGDIVKHFFNVVGLEMGTLPVSAVFKNTALSLSAVKFLYIYRKHLCPEDTEVGSVHSRNLFLEKLAEIGGERFYLGKEISQKIVTVNERSIAWASDMFDCDFNFDLVGRDNGINSMEELLTLSNAEYRALSSLTGISLSHSNSESQNINIASAIHVLRMDCESINSSSEYP